MSNARRVVRSVGYLWFALVLAIGLGLVAVRLLGGQVNIIESGSMAPTIPIDSVVITLPASGAELDVGDVITFIDGGDRNVMHRVTEVLKTGEVARFRTKGDANRSSDPLLLHEDAVDQRLWFSLSGFGPAARAMQLPSGIAWLALFPAALLLLGDRRHDKETADDAELQGTAYAASAITM